MKNQPSASSIMPVAWRYLRGDRVLTATGILLEDQGHTLRVEVLRDGKPSGAIASIPRSHLIDQAQTIELSIKKRFKLAQPSPEQLQRINTFLPNGVPDLSAEEVVSVPFIAADNLLNRGLDRWDLPSLATMATLLPGLPCLLDHDWGDCSKEWGRIYNAEFVQSRQAPEGVLNRAGNFDTNRQVVAKEGFAQVVFEVFAAADHPVVSALKRGHSGNISTGGFQFRDYVCPLCEVSFLDDACPHLPPDPYWDIYPDPERGIAPYSLRVGLYDMGEASIVTIPNLPNAGVI